MDASNATRQGFCRRRGRGERQGHQEYCGRRQPAAVAAVWDDDPMVLNYTYAEAKTLFSDEGAQGTV